jgi:hypothetical protein
MIERNGMNIVERQKKLNRLGFIFLLKSTWNGIHHGLMMVAMNLVFALGSHVILDKETADQSQFFGCIAIGIFVINRCILIHVQQQKEFKEAVAKIRNS